MLEFPAIEGYSKIIHVDMMKNDLPKDHLKVIDSFLDAKAKYDNLTGDFLKVTFEFPVSRIAIARYYK